MNPNTLTYHGVTPESLVLPIEYEFMSIENMDQLRDQELQSTYSPQYEVKNIGDVIRAQDAILKARMAGTNTSAEQYVASHIERGDNPELYDKLVSLVDQSSTSNANSELWNNGERDDDGNLKGLETSGKDRHAAALIELLDLNKAPDTAPPAPDPAPKPPSAQPAQASVAPPITPSIPTPPSANVPTPPNPNAGPVVPTEREITAAYETLASARGDLAKLSIQRRRLVRKNSKKARALEEKFDQAQKTYEDARIAHGAMKAQVSSRKLQENGVSGMALQTNVQAAVVREILDEHQAFTEAEAQHLTDDPRRRAKLARFFAHNKALFYGTNGAVGFGIGYGLNKATKGVIVKGAALAGAVSLPLALASVAAVKTTKAILQSSIGADVMQHKNHRPRADQDHRQLVDVADDYVKPDDDHEAMVTSGNVLLSNQINERTHKDIRSNRNRVIASAAIGGVMGGLGFLAADQFGGGHSHSDGSSSSSGESSGGEGSSNSGSNGNSNRGETAGYDRRVHIDRGNGYTQELEDLAEQKDIHLTDSQSWKLYDHLNDKFNGHFLSDDRSYRMDDGNWGISHPGSAHWRPDVVREMHRWIEQHENHLDKD